MKRLGIIVMLASLILSGAGCFSSPSVTLKPVRLEYWRVDDQPDTLSEAIADYRQLHPNVTIDYKTLQAENYETTLLTALADNKGPDIFSIPNAWLHGWQKKLLPLPKETIIPTKVAQGQKEVVVNQKSTALTMIQLKNEFVETVSKDVIMLDIFDPDKPDAKLESRIYGLPMSLDTLAMFVNTDLLKQAHFDKPAASWRDVQDQSLAMTALAADGSISQSGAAIGTADNVRYSPELVTTLMMQNGAVMADDGGYPVFSKYPPGGGDAAMPPGTEAVLFYQSFAAKGGHNYVWDASMPDSLDAFTTGKTAIYFGYPTDALKIKDRSPRLNFSVNPIPQIRPQAPANLAYYPVEVVSKSTANPNEAWDFIQFITRGQEPLKFLAKAKRPTALRALIAGQLTNADVGAFASQILTARSWYVGVDYAKVQQAFRTMISSHPPPEKPDFRPYIEQAEGIISSTLR